MSSSGYVETDSTVKAECTRRAVALLRTPMNATKNAVLVWELKVAATLARLLISDNRHDKAQTLFRRTISSFPSGNESNALRTNAILNELQHLPPHETSV